MVFKKVPSNIKYITVVTDIFLSICKEVNIEPSEATNTPIMAAYPELSSHDQNIWNKLFAGFSKELLFLQSNYPDYDLKDMIYFISVNGLSTMDQGYIDDSIKKGKYLKRKIREIKFHRFLSHLFILNCCMKNHNKFYNLVWSTENI